MARRLLSSRAHADLFEVPTEPDALIRHYLLSGDDIDLIRTRTSRRKPPWCRGAYLSAAPPGLRVERRHHAASRTDRLAC